MTLLTNLLLILGAGLILWLSYATVKRHPDAFSAEKMSRSFFTLGVLALLFIMMVAGLVFLLKH